MISPLINKRYYIESFIGNGKFGKVFRGIDILRKEHVAIKIETNPDVKLLKHEISILHYLFQCGCKNIPPIYWYGVYMENLPTFIMPFYERSLATLGNNSQDGDFSQNIHSIFKQMLCIVKKIHSIGVIHRDIKPHNFMYLGKSGEEEDQIVLIDFGFAIVVDDNVVSTDTESSTGTIGHQTIIGTPNYISPFIHLGETPSKRDDLISLGYIYLFLLGKWEEYIEDNDVEINTTLDSLDIQHPKNLALLEKKRLNTMKQKLEIEEDSFIYRFLQTTYEK